jgi:2-haloacid dehalogenase
LLPSTGYPGSNAERRTPFAPTADCRPDSRRRHSRIPAFPHYIASVIDALLFDLGNVLIRWDPRNHYTDRFASVAEMEAFLSDVASSAWNHEMDLGKPFAQAIAERSALHPDHAELLAEWQSQWERMLGGAIEESVVLLDEVRRAGYRVAALTNWSAETYPKAKARFPFLDWFEDVVISGVEGIGKPDPAMFALALRRTGFVAERTVFIDDNLPNIVGAQAAGMKTVHFTSPAQCRAELRALGVRV